MTKLPPLIVLKFGGTSVADLEKIRGAALHIKREYDAGNRVAVVVSAMAGATNQLISWCREISPLHDTREYDAVVASGEQVTAGLMALALQSMGVPARSWLGWQIPIETSNDHGAARITKIENADLSARLAEREVAIVPGFQGLSPRNRITTLGRGGSDTSAVALAIALGANRCDIYTDVDGIYTSDPRIVSKAKRIPAISFEEMLELASLGAKVLQVRSVELAMLYKLPVLVRSTFDDPSLEIDLQRTGSLVCNEEEIMEQQVVTGIAHQANEAKITLRKVPDRPGVASKVFTPLAEASINVDMIIQNISEDGSFADMTFTLPQSDLERAVKVLEQCQSDLGFEELSAASDLAKVSIVGIGMKSYAGVAARVFDVFGKNGINIHAITTSEIKISVLIESAYTELAVRALHAVFDLEGQENT